MHEPLLSRQLQPPLLQLLPMIQGPGCPASKQLNVSSHGDLCHTAPYASRNGEVNFVLTCSLGLGVRSSSQDVCPITLCLLHCCTAHSKSPAGMSLPGYHLPELHQLLTLCRSPAHRAPAPPAAVGAHWLIWSFLAEMDGCQASNVGLV